MKFRIKDLLPFLAILVAACIVLWVYFYFTERSSKTLAFPIDRNFEPSNITIGGELIPEYFEQETPIVYAIRDRLFLKRELKDERRHWTIVDANGHVSECETPELDGAILKDFSENSLYLFQNNAYYQLYTSENGFRTFFPADSLINMHCPTDRSKIYLEQVQDPKPHLRFSYHWNDKAGNTSILDLPPDNYNSYLERLMAYDGDFFQYDNYITYTCLHMPNIWVFTTEGKLLTGITTQDSVPMPSITYYENALLYERGKTFNSNMASFVHEGKLYVFSYRVLRDTEFVLDVYDLTSGRYLKSLDIPSKGFGNNLTIQSLLSFRGGLYIKTERGIAELRFK